ncbi:hypothetical protein B0I35DRAFT_453549 [Stachybotrys elegans]|uniref:BTB domain-containing protein n=1 Tax=Stachybotrys elegans TaxID=80388 RepID=A0A8K0SDD9_9HYPO|nr:hypothetical protein B0I35DRAFT_453549 [Stachybotrys elegans]
MTTVPYEEIISSTPFTFIVGPDEIEFTLHSALVASQSPKLDRLLNGQMKEAIERRVKFPHVDKDTFVRFGQYVYTGWYDEAQPEKRPVSEEQDSIGFQATEQPAKFPLLPVKRLSKTKSFGPIIGEPIHNSKRAQLWDTFKALHPLRIRQSGPRPNQGSGDHTGVFLSHVRMYVFADYNGVDALQNLALSQLRLALERFNLCAEGHNDISQLIKACFEETADKEGQADALRSLVCFYSACKIEELWKGSAFRETSELFPEFYSGLISILLNRLD